MPDKEKKQGTNISRRSFLKGVGTGTVAATVAPSVLIGGEKAADAQEGDAVASATIQLNINGKPYQVEVEARTTLLTVLRDGIDTSGNNVDLTGAKLICDRGECGGCTVMADGNPVYACMMLAMDAQDKQITTVEGLADGDDLHPVQEAFIQHDALMCGFCTPGFVVSSAALLSENAKPTLEEIKVGLSGNTCRCGTYPFIFDAVKTASKKM
ncbi:twin-arginine translocation signal domain-containing protein [Candidatus Poribacteria bacterium]|nr:2Fe-2S iron-sulfur cluster-binding protein [Candidatus Poribacteria bacterium]MYA69518.1 twin-arginine translocation signal domain-containing protein [Candidatus Poribacteria bacterium]MYH82285.1 twin-arginine translocation signal domain-containing protein [Candidatus Poribacteria bacterium]MYK96959.1 twin-arginine translocation signal domain-containing protein [Candidatus Poribacteria bacterium]